MIHAHSGTKSRDVNFMFSFISNSDIQEKARTEVDSIIGLKAPTYEDLKQFQYMDLVIKENMRYGSPAATTTQRTG